MADEDEKEEGCTEIEFFSAHEDADLRLRCFEMAQRITGLESFKLQLQAAQELYAWVMGFDEGEVEPAPVIPEDKCERRH